MLALSDSNGSKLPSNGESALDALSPAAIAPPGRRKLFGRAFYESIGSPKMVLAPMVDQSEFAWRVLTRSYMTPERSQDLLAYTPMLHSRMFVETPKFRDNHFQPIRSGLASLPTITDSSASDIYLDGNPTIDRPLLVQFCSNSPNNLLEAAKYVQPFCDAVDLNLGCPQGIARKGHYGAFLQEDWDLVYKLVNTLHKNLDVPVTAKMRILETKEKTLEYANTIVSAGASILTVHGRHRDQKSHNTGLADWSVIRYLRENLPPDTVLFANGNILRHEDIARCLEATGADGVMSAEGNLCDPTIFAGPPAVGTEGREYWRGRDGRGGYRMDAVFRRYMDILYTYVLEEPLPARQPLFLPSDNASNNVDLSNGQEETDGQPPAKKQKRENSSKQTKTTSPNLLSMQAHLFHLLRPLVSKHHDVRDALARSRAGDVAAFENVLHLVEKAVKDGLLDYENHPEKYEETAVVPDEQKKEEGLSDESSLATVRACKRPWWVCQPYVRPLPREALEKGSLTLSKKEKKRLEEEQQLVRKASLKPEGKVDTEKTESSQELVGIPKDGLVCG
ncbi:fmn-linked oxidoreductase [Lasallia pustulata]|uniref:tRNA-dihydrouridine(16/17) synthase [NAD(P)(+)] n=1 Tax=Lasallia pustulata TaxID=136370 RepID=A0A1W5DDW4_9LECA|nr:fmn-linked oxidoreductase [Lasallia pustulata]